LWGGPRSRPDTTSTSSTAGFTTRIDALESKLDARFAALDYKFERLEHRLDGKLEQMRSELMRTFGTWLLLSQAAVIAAISVVIALVALG
jgi:hypothetical protein